MTTAPNALTDLKKQERMPVLLSEEQDFEWRFSCSPVEAFALAGSCDPETKQQLSHGGQYSIFSEELRLLR
jgi:hypothetical protein